MDVDIEVCKPLDNLLMYDAFSGFETDTNIFTGLLGACEGNKWINNLLSYYKDRCFK